MRVRGSFDNSLRKSALAVQLISQVRFCRPHLVNRNGKHLYKGATYEEIVLSMVDDFYIIQQDLARASPGIHPHFSAHAPAY